MSWEIRQGDVRERLREMPDASVQCVVTSPPYWGLRDYGTAAWEGGDSECEHRNEKHIADDRTSTLGYSAGDEKRRIGEGNSTRQVNSVYRAECPKCGATRVDSQLGLESTPEQYVANLVEVFRELRRVLREDGTVWLVLGDSYFGTGRGPSDLAEDRGFHTAVTRDGFPLKGVYRHDALKSKDLCGIPWRVAFALQADGWWLRSDIIWSKPNPMPESVTDRPTRAHEYIFLLTKSARYFYDADAIREDSETYGRQGSERNGTGTKNASIDTRWHKAPLDRYDIPGRNRRSVWEIATQPYPEAHFATFPTKLVEPCILAGSSPKACGECGAPWERVIESAGQPPEPEHRDPSKRLVPGQAGNVGAGNMGFRASRLSGQEMNAWKAENPDRTLGWQPTCPHDHDSARCTVLDPFCGSGTVGVVALRHDRDFIGIELSEDYCELARNRIVDDAPLLNMQGAA